jgi:hypothetical protein
MAEGKYLEIERDQERIWAWKMSSMSEAERC